MVVQASGFQRPFVLKSIISGKRETRQETIQSGVLVFYFRDDKGAYGGILYIILLYMGFFCQAETSPMHKPRGKAVFSDPFTYLFF